MQHPFVLPNLSRPSIIRNLVESVLMPWTDALIAEETIKISLCTSDTGIRYYFLPERGEVVRYVPAQMNPWQRLDLSSYRVEE